jgi:hypothetical protein
MPSLAFVFGVVPSAVGNCSRSGGQISCTRGTTHRISLTRLLRVRYKAFAGEDMDQPLDHCAWT